MKGKEMWALGKCSRQSVVRETRVQGGEVSYEAIAEGPGENDWELRLG